MGKLLQIYKLLECNNFQDIFEIHKRLFIIALSICTTVPLTHSVAVYKHIKHLSYNQHLSY